MANEFIARKGLVVLANGATITGSLKTQGNINAVGYEVSASRISASVYYGDGSQLTGVTATGLDIDLFGNDLTGITVAGTDKMIVSDNGTEGRITVSQLSTPLAGTGLEADAGTIRIATTAAGNGLTGGGGSALAVGAGDGISVTTDAISINTSSVHFLDGVKKELNTEGVVSSSAQVSYTQIQNVPSGIISSSAQFTSLTAPFTGSFTGSFTGALTGTASVALNAVTASYISGGISLQNGLDVTGSLIVTQAVTASAFTGSFYGDGSGLTGIVSTFAFSGSTGADTVNLKTEALTINGSNGITTTATNNTLTVNLPAGTVSASGQITHSATFGYQSNEHVDHSSVSISAGSGLSGGGDITTSRTLTLDTASAHFTTGVKTKLNADGVISSSIQVDHDATTNFVANEHIDHSTVSITAGSGLSGGGDITSTRTLAVDTASAHFTDGVKTKLDADGVLSSSAQVDVRQTTGIATLATTGSNTFTGVQTISNTTNSTTYADGALIVAGGVGIAKDVNISGSLTIQGLLTVATMSTQYVTSSQYNIGVSRVVVNDDDLVRFAGLSVVDSGSTYGTGSLLWDSFENRWIYEANDQNYNSAILIAGPKNFGQLGNEVGLTAGRIPVAVGDDHIDTNTASSSIYIDFADRKTYVEAGLYITGSVTSSVGFSGSFYGDGSGLSNIATTLNVAGQSGGTAAVSLKTQTLLVSGSNGVVATADGQSIVLSGSNATTTVKGVASFTGSNFTVTNGEVSAKPINFNGTDLNLGGTYAFGLQNITSQGASTSDQLTLSGGAVISSVLYSSATNSDVDTGTEVVATVVTGSYDAAFFDYVVKKGTNYRAGTVMAVWDAAGNAEHTDTSTSDLGDTAEVIMTVDILGNTARLKATVSTDNWTVKTAVRAI